MKSAFHVCTNVGISGTTKVVVCHRQTARPRHEGRPEVRDIFEARVGIAIMGNCAPTTTEDSDPFDHRFRDNYAVGFGTTEEEALEALRADMASTCDALWA